MAADAIERETGVRAAVCPVCGYDRRGATGERCTECGKVVGAGVRSRIPWVGRRYTGRVRAYVRTSWMAVLHPGLLAEETRWRVNRRDAVRFYWVTILLATVVGTGMFAAAFAFRGKAWELMAPAIGSVTLGLREAGPLDMIATPIFVFWDSWWILLQMAAGLFAGLWAGGLIYRWLLGVGEGDRFVRRRVRVIGFYLSSVVLRMVVLAGMWGIAGMILNEDPEWLRVPGLRAGMTIVTWAAPAMIAVVFLVPTAVVAWKSFRERPQFYEIRLFLLGLSSVLFLPLEAPGLALAPKYWQQDDSVWGGVVQAGEPVLGVAMALGIVMGICLLVFRRSRAKVTRLWTFLLLFVPSVIAAWWVAWGAFWGVGYLVIGVASMLHK